MILNKMFLGFFCLAVILAHPLVVKRGESELSIRATKYAPPKSAAKPPPKMQLYTGNTYEDRARKANNAPGRTVPGQCDKASDCSCPKGKSDPNEITQSTSCINRVCSCNNAAVNFFAQKSIGAAAAFGNAPITKAVGQTMQTLSDVVEVAGTVAGTVLGPVGKYATKIALKAFPDVGPSHIDQATKGLLKKIR